MQHLARNVASVVRCEEHRHIRNVSRIGHAAQRNSSRARLYLLLAIAIARLSGIGQTRGDRMTRVPCGASSSAIARVIVTMPPLLAE